MVVKTVVISLHFKETTLGVLIFGGIYSRESNQLIFPNWSYFEFPPELIFAVADL